ncbi:MAG: NADH-quinone oxidoreductase subunit N [Bacteroidetes bacterium]|nr:NADH-quinone oxidoreductase subunit N [Bacteroidota bacterium]
MHVSLLETVALGAGSVGQFVAESMTKFVPETIVTGGFLLAIILDLFIKDKAGKKLVGSFALLVLAAAFVESLTQMTWWTPNQSWQGGTGIFPYTMTLFPPMANSMTKTMDVFYSMAVVDNFAVLFKLIISLSGMLVIGMSLMSREIEERGRRNGEFYSLLLAMTLGMFLMAESMDLVMMYVSLELVSISSYIMAGFMKDNAKSTEASMKYVLFGAFSSGLMIYGFSILYGLTGTTNITAIRQILEGQFVMGSVNTTALWSAVLLSLVGMGYKVSAAPFHFWTPDVYEGAPIPVTALLSVASKAGGFAMLMRFLIFAMPANGQTLQPWINWPLAIAVIAALTMSLGNFSALRQSNVKRMLAYSTIAHAGYMLVGLVTIGAGQKVIGLSPGASDAGVVSIIMYLIAYLFMNLGGFYVVMLIANKIGSEEVEDYKGFAKKSPMLAVTFSLFLVSLTGIPLTVGFIGKFYIFLAILKQPQWLWLAIVMALNSVVSLYYYVRVMQAMFIKQADEQTAPLTDAADVQADGTIRFSWYSQAYIFVFLVPTIVLGVYFTPLVDLAKQAIRFFNLS